MNYLFFQIGISEFGRESVISKEIILDDYSQPPVER